MIKMIPLFPIAMIAGISS